MTVKLINDWKNERTFFKIFNLDISEYAGGLWFELSILGLGIFIHNDKL